MHVANSSWLKVRLVLVGDTTNSIKGVPETGCPEMKFAFYAGLMASSFKKKNAGARKARIPRRGPDD